MRQGQLRYQQGFSLIEVMVAAVVTTVGLLGVFELHSQAKRNSFETANFAKATIMATDILDRIRLNPNQLANYAGSNFGAGLQPTPSVSCRQVGAVINSCSETELLAWDRFEWERMLMGAAVQRGGSHLGSPSSVTGCVFVDGINVEVVISWRGMVAVNDGASSNSTDAQGCGTANNYRRQISVTSVVMDRT